MKYFVKIIFSLVLISFLSAGSYAQSVVLCENYDSYGNPTDINTKWDIKPSGGYVYILYNQPNNMSTNDLWYLYIDKDWKNDGNYSAYETIELNPSGGKNWIVYDYKFLEAGKYIVSIQKGGREQARSHFQIFVVDDNTTSNTNKKYSDDDEVDTYYYEDSKIILCSSLDSDNKPLDEKTEYYLNREGGAKVKIFLTNNGNPFKTNRLQVSVYKENEEKAYMTFSVDIQPEWDYVSFSRTFNEPGSYLIDIYTDKGVFINTFYGLTIYR